MSGRFIFVAANSLKEGKLEDERKPVPELCEFIKATESRLIAFNEYASEDGVAVQTSVRFHWSARRGGPASPVFRLIKWRRLTRPVQCCGSPAALSTRERDLSTRTYRVKSKRWLLAAAARCAGSRCVSQQTHARGGVESSRRRYACRVSQGTALTGAPSGAPNGDSVSHAVSSSAAHGRLKKYP